MPSVGEPSRDRVAAATGSVLGRRGGWAPRHRHPVWARPVRL